MKMYFNTMKNYGNKQTYIHKQMKCNLENYTDTLITSEKLGKNLQLTKNGKSPGEYNISLELYNYAPEQVKMRLQ